MRSFAEHSTSFRPDTTYNLQGRMDSVDVDSDADGNVNNREEYEYDDSGIRVAKTEKADTDDDGTFDTTTRTDYHVDHRNPTGYAQVLEEMQGDTVVKSYTIGHDVFLEAVAANEVRHLLKDGHGSTRMLVDALGNVLSNNGEPQVYAYDAYGRPLGFTPSLALTTHLYSGERTDQLTGLQYLRARYYNPATGTFNRLDPFAGNFSDPQSLHKFLYCHADAVNGIDPSGHIYSPAFGRQAEKVIYAAYENDASHLGHDVTNGKWTRLGDNKGAGSPYIQKPDILNHTQKTFADVKPLTLAGVISAIAQIDKYASLFLEFGYTPDLWQPRNHTARVWMTEITYFNLAGIIFYTNLRANVQEVAALGTLYSLRRFVAANPGYFTNILKGALPGIRRLAHARAGTFNARMNNAVTRGGLFASMGVV